ncbi:hypothetical protein [Clostridium ljungdahlii]|uniref:Uncharacterized protein n=1 Tax=Clostridium ljungdahlii (strain ATCC 55383 / DSM 13528 / PETC) TaxID=748727 RepID=D8GTA6_CLOLD|nr:hypothetical protein [Clostridium ljungdahlii]ADK16705.1 hypothetical protein CLJU_c36640 [Clostridium ljungdahlii DSM 13528]OAA89419.1 hypothetical protein WX45_01251 [Clostridium ljungdahlii DSM 13528]
MSVITKGMIKDVVNENFEDLVLDISELKACIVTSGLKEREIKVLLMFNEQLLTWIKKVINAPDKIIDSENKIRFIKEIFNKEDE